MKKVDTINIQIKPTYTTLHHYLSKREERIFSTRCKNKEIVVNAISHKMLFLLYTKEVLNF